MAKRNGNVTEKSVVNADLRTRDFIVTFSRGKKACILQILTKSETTTNSPNYSSLVTNTMKDSAGA
jgi:hypothetical protein